MDASVQVALISTIGLIAVAYIGGRQVKATNKAKKDSQINADEASKFAEIAKDYAAAAGAKDALNLALGNRVDALEKSNKNLEEHNARCNERLDDVEMRLDEGEEQKRAASALERDRLREIDDLRAENERLKRE